MAEVSHEFDLSFHVLPFDPCSLPFSDHRLKSRHCSSRRPETAEAKPWHSPQDRPVEELDIEGVQGVARASGIGQLIRFCQPSRHERDGLNASAKRVLSGITPAV